MDINNLQARLDDFDYYRITKTKTDIKIVGAVNKEVKYLKEDSIHGISILGIKKNKSAFVSTNDLSEKNISSTIQKLKKLSKIGEKVDYLDLIDTTTEKAKIKTGKESKFDFEEVIPKIIKNSDKEKCSVNDLFYKEQRKYKNIITNYKNIELNSIYSLLLNDITVNEKNKMRHCHNCCGEQDNIDEKIETITEFVTNNKNKANQMLNYKSGLRGTYDVIIDSELSHLLAHEAIGHACEADLVYNKESNLKLGQKLSDYNLNVIDDPTIENSFGFVKYDDEGTKAKKRNLIQNGIVNEFLTDIKHAKKLNIPLNGAARAEAYNRLPIPRMSNTGLEKGDISLQELKADLKNGLILSGGSGGQVDPSTGTFQFGVKKATLFKDGKEENYANLSFSGNINKDLFKIDGISKESIYSSEFAGHCGKSGQSVPVCGFGPYVKFKNMRF